MTDKVLVIAAHPDDEVLGCGATMARHVAKGDIVSVLFVADGVSSRPGQSETLDSRRKCSIDALSILGVGAPKFLDFPDNRLDGVDLLDLCQAIEGAIEAASPSIVYTHHLGDLNVDHRLVAQAVLTALRPMPASSFKSILAFEVASSTEWAPSGIGVAFRPDHFINVGQFMEKKIAALHAYDHEMRPFPHARSYEALRALATMRGVSAGLPAAEAFMTLRSIER